MTLSDLPGGLPDGFIEAVGRRLLHEIRSAAEGRMSDVERGAESAPLAAALFDKFGWGVTTAARVLGIDTAVLQAEIDALARRIDPEFDANKKLRWQARPAAFSFEPRQGGRVEDGA
jgi:hypothetical protein